MLNVLRRTGGFGALAILVVLIALAPAEAFAQQSNGVFATVGTKAKDLFNEVRTIIFILGGFGLIGLAMGAIFGKINWKWFGGLAFGLVLLAVAGAVVEYLTGAPVGIQDSLQ